MNICSFCLIIKIYVFVVEIDGDVVTKKKTVDLSKAIVMTYPSTDRMTVETTNTRKTSASSTTTTTTTTPAATTTTTTTTTAAPTQTATAATVSYTHLTLPTICSV